VISSFQNERVVAGDHPRDRDHGPQLLVGYSGQLSLGHGAFMALGAYTSAILAHRYKMDYLVTIPIAGLLTGLVGFLFGVPALRLSPCISPRDLCPGGRHAEPHQATGRADGGVQDSASPSQIRRSSSPTRTSGLTGTLMTSDPVDLLLTLAYALVLSGSRGTLSGTVRSSYARDPRRRGGRGRVGDPTSPATRRSRLASPPSTPASPARCLGLATGFVSPDTFPVSLSIQLLVGAVVGGLASIPGPLLGGIFAYFLPIESNQLVPTLTGSRARIASTVIKAGPAVSYGVVLILIMIFAPSGARRADHSRLHPPEAPAARHCDREAGQMPRCPTIS